MSNTAHIIEVLTAIADDERAPAGERAAARRAIEVHQRKTSQPISPSQPADAKRSGDRSGFLFVFDAEIGVWCVFENQVQVGRWRGTATIEYQHIVPPEHYLGGRERWGYEKSWRVADPLISVTATVDHGVTIACSWQDMIAAESRIVIENRGCVYMFTATATSIDHRAIVFDVIRQSPTFEQASRASAPLTARPIRAIQAW